MSIKLNNEMYLLLIEKVEGAASLITKRENVNSDMWKLEVTDIKELQFLINDEIVYRGLQNQDTVNDLGKELYALYDEILYQKRNLA